MSEQPCFHCNEKIPKNCSISQIINGSEQFFCCYGCKAVASTILGSGLDGFYQFRTKNSLKAKELTHEESDEIKLYDDPELQHSFVSTISTEHSAATLLIEGITCAACIWLIEKHLSNQTGILSFTVNHTTFHAELEWNPLVTNLSTLFSEIAELGYRAQPYQVDDAEKSLQQNKKQSIIRIGIAGMAMMQSMMLAIPMYQGAYTGIDDSYLQLFRWVSLLVSLPVVFISARPFFETAFRDLNNRHLTMDVPVSLAIGLAFIASAYVTMTKHTQADTYFDSIAMFTFFLSIGRFIEMQARLRAESGTNALNKLTPRTAILVIPDPTNKTRSPSELQDKVVISSSINIGDIIKVPSASTFPADGTIIEGFTSIDESALTGEFMPKTMNVGQMVTAGTVNIENPVYVKVCAVGQDSKLHAITRLIARAQSEKPPVQQLADKIASKFVLSVLSISFLTALFWYFIEPTMAFRNALSVLVVTCPCALALATPAAFTTVTQYLREQGFLITKGHVLSALADSTDVYFDKTGTITEGRLKLNRIYAFTNLSDDSLMKIATSLEQHSSHPIANVFKVTKAGFQVKQFSNVIGRGLEGTINGTIYRIGKLDFCLNIINHKTDIESSEKLAPFTVGQWIFLSDTNELIGCFQLEDQIRASALSAIKTLDEIKLHSHLLSGDASDAVKETALATGIPDFVAGMRPEDKLNAINTAQSKNQNVIMVGDGINDVLVMAAARTSIAMGQASELTRLKSDAVLLGEDLEKIPLAILMAKKTRKIIKQNLLWALMYNLTVLPLAVQGMIPPWGAAIGMSGSSLFVVFNSLRLRKK